MPNKHSKHKREDWISVVITVAFVLGFLVLANSEALITGFTTVEPVTTIEFEVNSVIPSTATLEISSGTQTVKQNLSEFTIKLSEMQNIQPVYENDSLTAYNITNITIDLSKYNMQPTQEVTIRFIEVYKEITRETVTQKITKEEVIEKEITSLTESIENITEENQTGFIITDINFTIQGAFQDNVAPTVSDNSIPVGDTTVITIQHYSSGATSGTLWLTEDGNAVNSDDTGSDFYCANGASDINVASCGCATCTPNADCTVTMNCGNKDSGTIAYTVTAAGNDESPLPTPHLFRGGTDVGIFDLDSEIVTIEAGADVTPPVVNLQAPVNTTNSTTKYINFTYNVTDADNNVGACFLWLSKTPGVWELNYTDLSITETINQTFNLTVDDQSMLWRVECNDTSPTQENKANSTTFNISIDNNDPPIININFPENNTYSLSHSVNFTYNVTDIDKFDTSGSVVNCTLLMQKGGVWTYNTSNASTIQEGINQSINITLEHANINWTIECIDALGVKANATEGYFNYTVLDSTVTTTGVFPKNNTWQVNHSVSFTYNVTSLGTVTSCSLWLQKGTWELNKTDTGIEKNVNQTFNITLEHESVNWTVSCNNTFNEPANSSIMNFTVYDATPVVTLVWPENNTYQTSHKSINFTYNISSPDSAVTCDLYINDAWNSTDANIERGVNQTFNLTFDSYQNLKWSIGCNNSFNEYVNSTTYNYSMFEILNQPPTIPAVNISQPGDQSINLDSNRIVSFTFVACDEEETKDSLIVHANFTGEDSFFDENITCEATGWTNTTCKQFNCSMNIWFWYKAGSWNASMNVTDGTYFTHSNISTFTLGSTTGITISPSAIEWSTIYLGQWNKTSSNDPITINNTGNYNVTVGKVNITGYDLKGEETLSEYIPAINFTVDIETSNDAEPNIECLGTNIINETSTDITSSMLPRGNHTINDGTAQEQLYFCLRQVPFGISEQSYSTENSQQWIIGVS